MTRQGLGTGMTEQSKFGVPSQGTECVGGHPLSEPPEAGLAGPGIYEIVPVGKLVLLFGKVERLSLCHIKSHL